MKGISLCLLVLGLVLLGPVGWGADLLIGEEDAMDFPRALESYEDGDMEGLVAILVHRAKVEPFNLVTTAIFLLAVVHIMMTNYFTKKAHDLSHAYEKMIDEGLRPENTHSIPASILHLLGEIEAVFGLWAVVLGICASLFYSWGDFVRYINNLHYTEPLFKIVMMTIAASRPIIKAFEILLWRIVKIFGNTVEVWWLVILTLAPLLGAIITEPAAMTIAALLLADKFYHLNPSNRLKYMTLALLFINVSIGSSLTSLTGMPVLIVATEWQWNTAYMFFNFGIKALLAIALSTFAYYWFAKNDLNALKEPFENDRYKRHVQHKFISESELEASYIKLEQIVDKRTSFSSELDAYGFILKENIKTMASEKLSPDELVQYDIENAIDEKFEELVLEQKKKTIPGLLPKKERPSYYDPNWDKRHDRVPLWVICVHVGFLIWTVINAQEPVLFLTGFLFFLGFYEVTDFHQNRLDLKPALLVAFFLSGLMIHGTLQAWWIVPLLSNIPEFGLNLTAIAISSFKDNASIAYLGILVKDIPDALKYALFSGAITGGGLSIIANAPNAVGASILKKYFPTGISSGQLLKYALAPTLITALVFYVFK